MDDKVFVRRKIVVFLISVIIMALGVVLSTVAVLGTSPISSVPWVISLGTGYSLGVATILFNIVLILAGVLIMRRNFKVVYLGEVIILLIFSTMCDVFKEVFSFVVIDNYLWQWVMIFIAAVVLAFGVSLEVAANVTMMPGEFFISFVVFKTHWDFGKLKVAFDVSMIIIAAVLSMMFFGELRGVREGTVFAALFVGIFVRRYTAFFKKHGFYQWIGHHDLTARAPKKS